MLQIHTTGVLWSQSDHLLPYTINKKHDETLDSAVISRIVTSKEPIQVLTMVQIIDGNNTTDWVVRDSPTQKIGLGKYLQQIELDEPTELLKGIALDTLTITQPLTTDTYHPRYKLDDVIDRLLEITPTTKQTEITSRLNYKFKLDDNIRTLFHTIDSPEFFWNEYTLFDALVEIGTYLDRFPRVYIGDYNSTGKLTITFDVLDISNKTVYTVENVQTIETQQPLDNYANKVVSNVSNLSVDTEVVYPGNGLWIFANAPYDQLDISEANAIITLPYPIKKITKVEVYLDGDIPDESRYNNNRPVYEEKERQLILGQLPQEHYLWYRYGQNNIFNLADFTKVASDYVPQSNPVPSARGSKYRITYIPLMNAKVSQKNTGTQDYTVIYNQNNNVVETSVFAKHLENYVKKMENSDEVISKIYRLFSDIPTLGHLVNGKVLTNLSYEKYRDYYDVTMQLSQNYTRRSLFVRAKSEIRTWEISADKVLNRQSVYNDTVTFAMDNGLTLSNTNLINISRIFPAMTASQAQPTDGSNGTIVAIDFKMRDGNITSCTLLPTLNAFGRSIIFNFKTLDNTLIGYSKADGWLPATYVVKQNPISYTDSYGNFETMTIGFTDQYSDVVSPEFVAANYPLSTVNTDLMSRAYIKVPDIIIKKDTREKFEFTYQLDIKGYTDTIVHQNLTKFAFYRFPTYETYILLLNKQIYSDNETISPVNIIHKIRVVGITKISNNRYEYTIDKTLVQNQNYVSVAIAFDIPGMTINNLLMIRNNITVSYKDNLVFTGKINVYLK